MSKEKRGIKAKDICWVLVTGGAGYVGSVLVPKLLEKGYKVKVIDLYIYGEDVLDAVKDDPNLVQIKGDIRDRDLLFLPIPIQQLSALSEPPEHSHCL